MKIQFVVLFVVVSILSFSLSPAGACHVNLQCRSSEILDGEHQGWYKYSYEVSWYMQAGKDLDYWELKLPCDLTEEAIFTEFLGFSNSLQHPFNPQAIIWDGFFLDSDPVLGIACPVLRFAPDAESSEDVLQIGAGRFEVVSNLIPHAVSLNDVIILKYVGSTNTLKGDLVGCCYPTNFVVPEPATVLLLGLGSSMLFARKR